LYLLEEVTFLSPIDGRIKRRFVERVALLIYAEIKGLDFAGVHFVRVSAGGLARRTMAFLGGGCSESTQSKGEDGEQKHCHRVRGVSRL
jgi:hypothetical protein